MMTFFDLSIDLLCVAGVDGRFKEVNPSWEKTLGWSREELLSHPYLEFVHPDDRERTVREAAKLAGGADTVLFRNRYRCKDGSYRWLQWTTRAPRPPTHPDLYAVARDVTSEIESQDAIRRLNDELHQKVAELEAFSYTVSHDLRAPLRHAAGFADLLERHAGTALDEKSRRYVGIIRESVSQMGRLIDDLLEFSRLGRMPLQSRRLSLEALVRECVAELSRQAEGRTIEWRVSSLPEVSGDPALLRQVVLNLLGNGVKYTRRKPDARIEVDATTDQGHAVVHVRDNGAGFDPAYASKLFGVFQRLHHADEFEGTGIGLATVKRIVERHGGRVWAEGKPGEGAAFHFTIPLSREGA